MRKARLSTRALKESPSESTHIIPLGWEYDRAVLPFLPYKGESPRFRPHRVYLLVPNRAGAGGFDGKVETELKKVVADVRVVELKRSDGGRFVEFEEIVSTISRICHQELTQGNRVHINMSAGSKMAAFAAGLAGMAHINQATGSIYYVEPESYERDDKTVKEHGLAQGMKDVKVLQPVELHLPDRILMHAVAYLNNRPKGRAKYLELIRFLRAIPDSGFEDLPFDPQQKGGAQLGDTKAQARAKMQLIRRVVEPLEEQELVHLVKRGRERELELTLKGVAYARLAPPLK